MIQALTPNLALDRTHTLSAPFCAGTLSRPQHVREVAGGKGVNLSRAVARLGGSASVHGFTGGWNGKKWRALMEKEGLTHSVVEIEGETRECHIFLDPQGTVTEVYEPSPTAPLDAWKQLCEALAAETTVLAGSMTLSADVPLEAVFELLPPKLIVDSSGDTLSYALKHGASLVTPNLYELAELVNTPHATWQDAVALYEQYGTPILLTMGSEGAAYIADNLLFARPPAVQVKNPVASGDSLLSAFLFALTQGETVEQALALGVAAGADNAQQGGDAQLDAVNVRALATRVQVTTGA